MSIDYARARVEFPKQKVALTRAVKKWKATGDREPVVKACRAAVQAWDEWGAWPDDWARWQRALDDTLDWYQHQDLREL